MEVSVYGLVTYWYVTARMCFHICTNPLLTGSADWLAFESRSYVSISSHLPETHAYFILRSPQSWRFIKSIRIPLLIRLKPDPVCVSGTGQPVNMYIR